MGPLIRLRAVAARMSPVATAPFMLALLFSTLASNVAPAQSIYAWNNFLFDWNNPLSWMTLYGTGGGVPSTNDTAEFTGGLYPTVNNPVLNTSVTLSQLIFTGSPTGGWDLSGSGSLAIGTSTTTGIVVSGGSNQTINLGNGSGVSLTVNGPTVLGINQGITVGSGSLTLAGNTVVNTTGVSIQSGDLILDNSAGNPAGGQRLTITASVNAGLLLSGGGSTLEFRGASSGSTFNFGTSNLMAGGAGTTYLRTVNDGGSMSITFNTLVRQSVSGALLIENVGAGYVGDNGNPTLHCSFWDQFPVPGPLVVHGILSASRTISMPWAAVTNRPVAGSVDVTGRWANYSGGIVASTTTAFQGDFSGAPANANILFNPQTAGPVTLASASTAYASVVLEPAVQGVSLNVGTGLNTYGLMLSGTNDISINGFNLFSTSNGRELIVLSPAAALTTNASLNINSNFTMAINGEGFIILDGTSNQLFPSSMTKLGVLSLGGGVLRGTSSNLSFGSGSVGVELMLRGGVLEYDVSAGNTAFNLPLGTGAGQVNWTAQVSKTTSFYSGGGGFSAYSVTPGNSLTVNIGGAGQTLYWNDSAATNPQPFITDGYALKFGSLRSNATVIWQNPIALDGNSDGSLTNTLNTNRAREINVTMGVGNAADQTQMTGVISGSVNTDLVKTGTGVLVLTADNTYQGRTFVNGGELRVMSQTGAGNSGTGTGAVFVNSGGTLGGNGQALGQVSVLGGGTIRGGDGTSVNQTLTTGNLTFSTGATINAVVASGLGPMDTGATGASLIASSGTLGRNTSTDVINIVLTNDGSLTLDGSTTYTRQIASFSGQAINFNNGNYTASDPDFAVTGSNFSVAAGWAVNVSPGSIEVIFAGVPTPESAHVLFICFVVAAIGWGWCRRRNEWSMKSICR